MHKMIYLAGDFDTIVERISQDKDLKDSGLTEQNIKVTLKSFDGDELATTVFYKKYALRDCNNKIVEFTLEESKDRWARAISSVEKKFNSTINQDYFKELYKYFLPGGRQMFGLGNDTIKNVSYNNCYVTDIEEDSIEGIFDVARKIARTYSYGGGIGFCLGKLRPKKSKVSNTSKFSTGSVSFMPIFSLVTETIGQSGRRGALLLSMPVNHPDIEDFIEIKHNNPESVQYANISIKITDDFMDAVIKDKEFDLTFVTPHEQIIKKIRAKELWDKIIKSARDSAEPGLLFWDNIKNDSPTEIYEQLRVVCTNPCGELPLSKNLSCCLGSLLLHNFVLNPFTDNAKFDFDMFKEIIKRAVRHLDNVVELNIGKHPLEEQEEIAILARRIGLGITGLADMFAYLNLRYDSEESLNIVEKIMKIKMEEEYKASIELAKERGSFPLFDKDKHYEKGFCSRLPEEIKKMGKQYGQRNVGLSTVAPSGSISVIAQCSSGIEPIFALSYSRTTEMGGQKNTFNVCHHGISKAIASNNFKEKVWVAAHDINHKFRISLQKLVQLYVDASISSTINLPKETTTEIVGQLYIDAWKEGLKGITVYREGSREGVLITDDYAQSIGIPNMNTSVHCVHAEGGDKFYIMISYENKDIRKPYQVFVMNYKKSDSDAFVKISNSLIKMLREKKVPEERIIKYINRSSSSLVKMTRFLSLSMKTGNLSAALKILDEHAFAGTLASKLYDILSKSAAANKFICPNCGSSNIKNEESCISCLDCNWSKCH